MKKNKILKKKIIITIPAYNEEVSIGLVIKSIPKVIPGIGKIEILVWNDGSTDNTVKKAFKAGADYVFSNKKNLGLAKTFNLATNKAVELGADIIVNTDADNQYDQKEIVKLVKPILENKADLVNGDRQVNLLQHMPWQKKYGNILGSWTIRMLTGLTVNDASSGFRAYTASAIEKLNVFSGHTYTHETLIQAIFGDLVIKEVAINFKPRAKELGSSRLVSGVFYHIFKSGSTIIRTILMYQALKYSIVFGSFSILASIMLGLRYLYYLRINLDAGHVQSLILASMLFNLGIIVIMLGLIADLISINRKMYSKNI